MPPIATDLEADRLRHRERRLLSALAVLEGRAERYAAAGREAPAALTAMIDGFRGDLAETLAQLD